VRLLERQGMCLLLELLVVAGSGSADGALRAGRSVSGEGVVAGYA
jgi:hypothetical protein